MNHPLKVQGSPQSRFLGFLVSLLAERPTIGPCISLQSLTDKEQVNQGDGRKSYLLSLLLPLCRNF